MKLVALALLLVVVLLTFIGCRREKKQGKEMATRKECNAPAFQCYDKCVKRNASDTCGGCCWDQRYLCDTGQKPSWEYCDSAQ